jgi:hypothetical protein
VYENVERLYMSTSLIDSKMLVKTEAEMEASPLRGFHRAIQEMCGRSLLMTQATYDEAIFRLKRPPRMLPAAQVVEIGEARPADRIFCLMESLTPALTESLEQGIAAYIAEKRRVLKGARGKGARALQGYREIVERMDALLVVAKHWNIEARPSWDADVGECHEELSRLTFTLTAAAPAFEPRKRPATEPVFITPSPPRRHFRLGATR